MAVELTRMDFHVARFMESEAVEDMSAEEIGQFCLLLFKAWLLAKDCTLPDDTTKLATYARVSKVSSRVLDQFPRVVGPLGRRRRNEVQYGVWIAARARSEAGKNAAAMRWHSEGNAASNAQTKHTKQSIPEQAGQAPSALEIYTDMVVK